MIRTLAASLAAALAATAASATLPDEPVVVVRPLQLAAGEAPALQVPSWQQWSEQLAEQMRASMGAMFGGRLASSRTVRGAPYSAEVVTEARQSLADGNVISRKTTGHVYRDGEGRTRQETGVPGKDPAIFINDPVAGKALVVSPGSRRVVVTPRAYGHSPTSRQVVKVDGSEVRIENGKVFLNGKQVDDAQVAIKSRAGKEVRVENGRVFIDGKELKVGNGKVLVDGQELDSAGGPPHRVVVSTLENGDGVRREEVRVQVVRPGEGALAPLPPMPPVPPMPPAGVLQPLAPLPPMPGVQSLRFESTARLGKGVTSSLGVKEFDGVRAEGKSTVWTIPAGEIGNRNPIQITSESWYSPDLQVTVYSRYADPRTGEAIYRLAGIRRAEPAADLFRAPEGYEVKDPAAARTEQLELRRREHQRRLEERQREREQRRTPESGKTG
jgi:hypothetical protein